MHNRQPTLRETLSPATPVAAVEYLKKNPPKGQVFNTYEWGDYLLWAGPKDVQVFVASHVQYVPREVWRHYLTAAGGSMEAQTIFDRYGVNTLLVDKLERRNLIARMKDLEGWDKAYDDGLAVIYRRKKPI
jgi:hypothetical protein